MRLASEVISSNEKTALALQLENKQGFRRSPVYNGDYFEGSVFSSDSYDLVRPEIGLSSLDVKHFYGTTLARDVKKGSLVNKKDFR